MVRGSTILTLLAAGKGCFVSSRETPLDKKIFYNLQICGLAQGAAQWRVEPETVGTARKVGVRVSGKSDVIGV